MLFSGVVFAVMYVLKLQNMWLFLWLGAIGYLGLGFFNTVIWANITDVIDDQEVQTGHRDDGTVYAVYSFARKVGQALAGGIGGWALQVIGYEPAAAAMRYISAMRIDTRSDDERFTQYPSSVGVQFSS